MKTRRCCMSVGLALAGLLSISGPAVAAFHLWDVVEVFSNEDGSVQFIELFTTFNSQGVLAGHTLVADSDGTVVTFTFPGNISNATANQRLLFATMGFDGLDGGVSPDYIIPAQFFDPGATSITINFAEGQDTFTFAGAALPMDGVTSLLDDGSTAINSPTNFDGVTGSVDLDRIHDDGFED